MNEGMFVELVGYKSMFAYFLCRPARNPYDTNKIAGGSSSGSASLVSAGLCPVALGVDGGGICFISLHERPEKSAFIIIA